LLLQQTKAKTGAVNRVGVLAPLQRGILLRPLD
jgi:hypothetical protein